jgi:peptidoglycan/xylan/chitin deacetylase (PgdA/CDA1 family)
MRRYLINRKHLLNTEAWPIDKKASTPPEGWVSWPDGKKFALVLTHDVETVAGIEKCQILSEIEEHLGYRSSFNFVSDDYQTPLTLKQYLTNHGFEIGIHGLKHRKNPFVSERSFKKHAIKINSRLEEWKAVGYRSPCMYHNLDFFHYLNIEYDASTFDTDPFEPQPDGMGTIFPFWVANSQRRGYVELPYTLPQDFLLFVLMREPDINIWKEKLDWIADSGGMALFITHPDYMNFDKSPKFEEYPARHYADFLKYIESKYKGQYWNVLPRDMARWWTGHFRK